MCLKETGPLRAMNQLGAIIGRTQKPAAAKDKAEPSMWSTLKGWWERRAAQQGSPRHQGIVAHQVQDQPVAVVGKSCS